VPIAIPGDKRMIMAKPTGNKQRRDEFRIYMRIISSGELTDYKSRFADRFNVVGKLELKLFFCFQGLGTEFFK
jgi:hypothetical protein